MAHLAVLALVGQHIAGFPVEELAIAVIASTAPLIAYLGGEASRHLTRLRRAFTSPGDPRTTPRSARRFDRRTVVNNRPPPTADRQRSSGPLAPVRSRWTKIPDHRSEGSSDAFCERRERPTGGRSNSAEPSPSLFLRCPG